MLSLTVTGVSQSSQQRGKGELQMGACRSPSVAATQKCPQQWSKVLKLGANKTAIIQLLVMEWAKDQYAPLLPDNCDLYVTSGDT